MSVEMDAELHDSFRMGRHRRIREILEKDPRQLNSRNKEGVTLLQLLALHDISTPVPQLLSSPGIDLNARHPTDGRTALTIACETSHRVVAALARDTRVHLTTGDWKTCIREGYVRSLHALLASGRRVDPCVMTDDPEVLFDSRSYLTRASLRSFRADPIGDRLVLVREDKLVNQLAADLFVCLAMLRDGHYTVREGALDTERGRFAVMGARLPEEIQMQVCWAVFGHARQFISPNEVRLALGIFAENMSAETPAKE